MRQFMRQSATRCSWFQAHPRERRPPTTALTVAPTDLMIEPAPMAKRVSRGPKFPAEQLCAHAGTTLRPEYLDRSRSLEFPSGLEVRRLRRARLRAHEYRDHA